MTGPEDRLNLQTTVLPASIARRRALIVQFGGFSRAAMMFACIYILGLAVARFPPETKGRPLPA